jgi:predicted DNA-binding transcriptional regulator AlpA
MMLVRVKEIARQYSMSPSTFYRWHCYKKFPKLFSRIGKILFVDESEFRKMARESKESMVEREQ